VGPLFYLRGKTVKSWFIFSRCLFKGDARYDVPKIVSSEYLIDDETFDLKFA
jgi:hypothetical protein